MSHISCR